MHKRNLKFSCFIVALSVFLGGVSEAAQTINGKALGSVHDVVKEVSKGDISLPKKGLITLRAGGRIDDVDVFATTFGKDASASTKRLWHNSNTPRALNWSVYEPYYLRPAVSRKIYNGKRALMYHNFAPNGELKYLFKTLSNNRTENTTDTTPSTLTNSVQISDIGEYTPARFSNAGNHIGEVYGSGVMAVKGYDREIFVGASGTEDSQKVRLEFFAISADNKGNLKQEPLTALTHETPYRGSPKILSLAVGDIDGDKYDNEVALIITTEQDIFFFVYRLNYSDGKLTLRSLGDAKGFHVHYSGVWGSNLEEQPVADMAVGDFDGDGRDEIAIPFKFSARSTTTNIKDDRGWPNGPMVGDIYCRVFQWNAAKQNFDLGQGIKSYTKEDVNNGVWAEFPYAKVSGVVGLRATAADLDGDGRDEIVTLLLGYVHRKAWDSKIKVYKFRGDDFYAYPHLAVWTFDKGSITPKHDDSHVKGGGQSGENNYNFGVLYDLAKDKNTKLLGNDPFLAYQRVWYNKLYDGENKTVGPNPDHITHMYALIDFSIVAGPFTGTLGTFKTVDDIAVAWKRNSTDYVTVFKTKLNAAKQFDGFEDGKTAVQDKKSGGTWRGLVAVDMAGEGVELGTPTHIRKTSNRSYVAALSAIPYHVDTVNAEGTDLTGGEPVNFTYSEFMNGGDMTVSYGKTTVDSSTDSITQDLSQSIETMFAADPTGTDTKVQEKFGTAKGLVAFGSAIGEIVHGAKIEGMSTEEKRNAVWKPDSPTAGLTDMMDFLTDKVDTIDERTNSETSTTTIDKNITATTHDAILYTDTARHIWRYPVMTRPLPMWLAWGPRVDSTQIDDPGTVKGDKELFLTFTMSENSALHTSSSINDSLYQPLHEEGNFFSYPSQIGDVEGYNDAGILADENTWEFSNTLDSTGMNFTKATTNMQHTEKKVTPSGFTATVGFFDRLINGDKATGIRMPNSDNPKTFSKQYSKTERISYSLQGSSTLTAMQAAEHTVKMQPFVAKEGAMTLGTAVELSSTNSARLWESSSIYSRKPDPALLLPLKFVKDGATFRANTYDKSAMKIRGVRFYMPDFAFFTDNRLVNGMNYEIRVPLYNASFKDTGNFNVRLSWANENLPAAVKTPVATVSMNLKGWSNNNNDNKGTAVFNWKPDLTSNKQYYFYVEIDPDNTLDEVHEGRYKAGSTTINDYGGNNTGFYPFYVYDIDDDNAQGGGAVLASNIAAADEVGIAPLYFTDGNDNRIDDMADFIITHSNDSFVTVTANFSYSGQNVPYAFFVGYTLTPSGRAKLPNAGINTIVDLNALEIDDVEDVFMFNDIALFNGTNKVTFTFMPSELAASASEITSAAASAAFGVITLTDEDLTSLEEEFYEGVDPFFELEAIPDNIVSSAAAKTYTLNSDTSVFWKISGVKPGGTASTSDAEDARDYLDITLETISEDEAAPSDYGRTVNITVSSIAGYTPKGDYEITVQKSEDCDEWTDAEVLRFTAESNSGNTSHSSGSGCNAGFSFGTLAFLMGGILAFRKKS